MTNSIKYRRLVIDTAFARMAGDAEYHTESQRIVDEFAAADWEALQIAEHRPAGDGDARDEISTPQHGEDGR